jgi:hypothetical protein
MLLRVLAAIGIGTACLPAAEQTKAYELKQKVQVSNTQRIEFPSGGTIRLRNAIGVLTVEAWDRSDVEITTIKSTKGEYAAEDHDRELENLGKVHIAAERHGNELVVTTDFPRYRVFPPPYPIGGKMKFDLEYRIKAPAAARIVDERHDVGQVNIDGLVGDIDVNLLQGEIMLHLPEDGQYSVVAKADFGSVNSDFAGQQKRRRRLVGHRIVKENEAAAHKLNLRVGFGDVVILKTRVPKAPEPMIPAPKPEGL